MKKCLLYIALTFLLSSHCFSQFSKTHYIPPISNSTSVTPEDQFMYISTPSNTDVSFTITEIGGAIISGTVSRDVPFVYDIGSNNSAQLIVDQFNASQILNNRGYIVEAGDLIYVTIRVIAGNGNQASQIVSKGLAALGTEFRIGGFTNLLNNYNDIHYTFASILATENNTVINFANIKTGAVLTNNAGAGNTPSSITLNAGQSYVIAVQGPTDANRDALIGSSIISDKPIVVNCGSFGGSNAVGNLDLGFDQIVSAERTGDEYIFVKSSGVDVVERVLLIANQDNTEIFLNGATIASYTLNIGQYVNLLGSDYDSSGNLYVKTNSTALVKKTLFAYQCVGDDSRPDQANQEMFFVPPLSCQTPKEINNIPYIQAIGARDFTGRVTITTVTGATLNFILNGVSYTLSSLPGSINVVGPTSVTGNANYQCYVMTGFTGNVSVFSTGELYLAAYGSDGAATFGGYYSGFIFKPEVTFQEIDLNQTNCIPNVELSVNTLSGFDVYQWYFNDVAIAGANTNSYTPTQPGFYYVKATLSACGIFKDSDKIPVSNCPDDDENDGTNNNVDIDLDNDGNSNCNESLGDQPINISNINAGTINGNTFTGTVTTSTAASTIPITGNANGSFISDIPAGKTSFATYKLTFTQPISLSLQYNLTSTPTDELNANAEYVVNSPNNTTITVINPSNQLSIDTNYDGIYENNVTQFSSFEIRFRLNSTTPLASGTGTFKFQTYNATSISFTHKNLLDLTPNRVSLNFVASCVGLDSDGDGVFNSQDYDSDNDGIPDFIENQPGVIQPLSGNDANNDGLDDIFATTNLPANNDTDLIPNYLDLDSDNDGIYDLDESGTNAIDANNNGVIDGTNFGSNGLNNVLETLPDNGILNYTIADTDADGILNYLELDSDNDLCNDVIEAGFADANNDGYLGTIAPPTTTANGTVSSGTAYTNPNNNYITAAPIVITTQPVESITCELEDATFTIDATSISTYQWEQSVDGTTWTTLVNNANYSGVNTVTLSVLNVTTTMNNYKYRVFLNRTGNTCGLYSANANLKINALPVITTPITLIQCDDDTDGISTFNLTQKNNQISTNSVNEVFTYYTSSSAAALENNTFLISNPIAFTTTNTTVFARVENTNGCYRICTMNLIISSPQIPNSFIDDYVKCDDFVDVANDDKDGIATFNFSSATAQIINVLPTGGNYTIKYYKNEADFYAETDASGNSLEIPIATISSYRNSGYPNVQTIWARVDSTITNDCFGFTKFNLVVEALPIINNVGTNNVIRACDDDQDGILIFNTANLESTLLGGQTNKTIVYTNQAGAIIPSPFPPTYQVTTSQIISVYIKNNETVASDAPCNETGTFKFIVDDLPQAFDLPINALTQCDDNETDPSLQDGKYPFVTTSIQSDILQGQTGMVVTYTFADGTTSSTLPNPFETATQTVTVRVANFINATCWDETELKFIVNPIPKINLNVNGQDNELVCTNLPTFIVTLDAAITDGTPQSNYTYQWFLDGTSIPLATNYTLDVNTEGTYTVEVTNTFGCPSIRTIIVTASEIASIQTIEIIDLSDSNSVLVNVTGNGGDYVYSIQESFGPYQTSNLFTNVAIGFHTVYIKDLNGCGIAEQIISVLGVPKYFTPNGDGFNDTWNIKGANQDFYADSIIYIFDRYGKLIKQISPIGNGWDGTINENLAPSDDYWYSIKFDDGRSAKGHFTLKR